MWGRGVLACAALFSITSASAECGGDSIAAAQVTHITGERSFKVGDGREIVLAGIEVPATARGALQELIKDRAVTLRRAGTADRYGRIPAYVTAANALVQRQLLARGQARVAARIGDKSCAAELLAAEKAARAEGVGLWADPAYAVARAEDGAKLLTAQGFFAVAEGQVLSVRESGGTIYMNFGRRWSEALTVTISKRSERIFADAGVTPKSLEKRRIRVRGVIEERNGPRIEAQRPEQIEVAEAN